MRLLLTRPEADAQRTAQALRALGHEAIIAPLLRIAVTANAEIGSGPWAAILITSANAAHAIATHTAVTQFQALPSSPSANAARRRWLPPALPM